MATKKEFVEFVVGQIGLGDLVFYRKMFGEYAVYYENKVVALVCDNKLFVKPTIGGRTYIGQVVEASAYPGAKPSFLIEDKVDDQDWIKELILITASELPEPKPKKKKNKK